MGTEARACPAQANQPPANRLLPPSLLRQIALARRSSSLLHHSNCGVVCVHQGNSRDSKLNSNMQFIQDIRPIERLSAESSASSFRCKILLPWPACPHTSSGTKSGWGTLWSAGQMLFHFTDGLAGRRRRACDMRGLLASVVSLGMLCVTVCI